MSVAIDGDRSLWRCCCDLPHLTETQISVLLEITGRKSSKQAGTALGVSSHTVDSHVKDMLRVTGAGDRGELVRMAIEQQIVDFASGTAARTRKRCVQPRLPAG
jgi:DNA-binding CsgD family transcriptional regulator